jgi:phospholipid-translocating ATPase
MFCKHQVAVSCGLINTGTTRYYLTDHHGSDETTVQKLKDIRASMEDGDNTVFIVDGEALSITLRECPKLLCEVSMKAFRVVCVRMTPLQKAQVVRMVRNTPGNPTTAAVGDGKTESHSKVIHKMSAGRVKLS